MWLDDSRLVKWLQNVRVGFLELGERHVQNVCNRVDFFALELGELVGHLWRAAHHDAGLATRRTVVVLGGHTQTSLIVFEHQGELRQIDCVSIKLAFNLKSFDRAPQFTLISFVNRRCQCTVSVCLIKRLPRRWISRLIDTRGKFRKIRTSSLCCFVCWNKTPWDWALILRWLPWEILLDQDRRVLRKSIVLVVYLA